MAGSGVCLEYHGSIFSTLAKLVVGAIIVMLFLLGGLPSSDAGQAHAVAKAKNAYATMLYMGTPRDYEFYVAARVMFRSLKRLKVDADLVVIASSTVPPKWKENFHEDGVRIVTVEDIPNPYSHRSKFEKRFMFTLNKLYAWTLTDYERVVMLDVDNVFLQKTDELFQCGDFCAAFINPCIFHTGLFVLKPSNETFGVMRHDVEIGRKNSDGADQGFLTGHFNDLLDRPMFHPPADGFKLSGSFRLPFGYQMDASHFYMKLKWNIPCGPNSVVTFPSVPLLKPWYWWSYPVLPLGLLWHEQRLKTVGYGSEVPLLVAEALFYVVTMVVAMVVRRRTLLAERTVTIRCCFGRGQVPFFNEIGLVAYPILLKVAAYVALILAFVIPWAIIPTTVHPLMGWGVWLVGSLSLLTVIVNIFQLPSLAVITPWLGFIGALLVMANPYYVNGVIRALALAGYSFVTSPLLWWMIREVSATIDHIFVREPSRAWTSLPTEPQFEMMKLC